MKYNILSVLFLAFFCGTTYSYAETSGSDSDDVIRLEKYQVHRYRQGEVIVKFKEHSAVSRMATGRFRSSGVSSVDNLLRKIGIEEVQPLMPFTGTQTAGSISRVKSYNGSDVTLHDMSKLYHLRYDVAKYPDVLEVVCMLTCNEEVEYAEPNYLVYALSSGDTNTYSSEPLYTQQWGLEQVRLPALWDKQRVWSRRPVIAILDTGVDITHPDLAENIWTNDADADGDGVDSENNGFIDDIHGWDFVNNSNNIRDNNGHGTHCAGIAAAVGNNGIGITGANPDAYIMPVTVLQSNGQGDVATIIKGIDYAVANGADIISMSFGNYTHSVAEEQALAKAYSKCVLVAAAGNDGHDMINDSHHLSTPVGCLGCVPTFPAAFNWVIGVMASQETKNLTHSAYNETYLADFSNYDCNGPIYSSFDEEKLYNYEIMAPGTHILSTFPGGQYKYLNGTSMACPLVAGAISRMMESLEETSKEIILSDIIQASRYRARNGNKYALSGLLDIYDAANMTEESRPVDIVIVSVDVDDSEGDNDGFYDAGETVSLTPVIRCISGNTYGLKMWLELSDMEDPDIIEFIDNYVDFGHRLSTYGKEKSVTPLKIRISPSCADNRIIDLTLKVQGANMHECVTMDFPINVESGVELRGILQEDMTLSPGNKYVIPSDFCVPQGKTLTILPGTKITCRNLPHILILGQGGLKAEGEPGNMITFECTDVPASTSSYSQLEFRANKIKYARFTGPIFVDGSWIEDCIFDGLQARYSISSDIERSNIVGCKFMRLRDYGYVNRVSNTNIIGNTLDNAYYPPTYQDGMELGDMASSNVFSNFYEDSEEDFIQEVNFSYNSGTASILKLGDLYFGSSNPSIIRNTMIDAFHPVYPVGYGTVDISNVATRPSADAHGIVWKVLVDGIDPRDEADLMLPLGVGRHKFEVYYNRPIDKSVTPFVSMGVRAPYSQTPIMEEAEWNEAGDIYTAYLTITSKRGEEGMNRISVRGGQDLEGFDIPTESSRYNVMIQKTGSLSSGMMASAGVACVRLSWETPEVDGSEDIMGYNLCRYTLDADSQSSDTVIVNKQLMDISELEFTDYDVNVGTSYYYYLSEITTDLKSSPITNTVTATPLTATMGDSNGSGAVDVADVVTDIAYMTGQNPRPFVFDAADVNGDTNINILDVVGTVRVILGQTDAASGRYMSNMDSPVDFCLSNGILSMSADHNIAGLQFTVTHESGATICALEGLKGYEVTALPLSDTETMYIIYSMSGKTWSPGRTPLLAIDSLFDISSAIVSDAQGQSLSTSFSHVTGVQENKTIVSPIGFTTITALDGRRVSGALSPGIYIVTRHDKNGNIIRSTKHVLSK